LEQREGRAIRKGNGVAREFAGNQVDVIIYAVEKSLDAYKFNLLHNKQSFIMQLKTNRLGARTIDEGSMDEHSGMNFSEYVAILSGNTDLLEKAKLDKKVAALESERQSFAKNRAASEYKLEYMEHMIETHAGTVDSMKADWEVLNSQLQYDGDGSKRNPLRRVFRFDKTVFLLRAAGTLSMTITMGASRMTPSWRLITSFMLWKRFLR
jgi:hypothetical protein